MAFLQGGPTVKRLIDFDEDTEQVQLEGGLSEVARIRVSGPVALSIAVNIIETLMSAGKVRTPALMETLSKIMGQRLTIESESEA